MKKLFIITAVLAAMLTEQPVEGFPPAPHHVLYGLVRDEYGNPLTQPGAEVVLETSTGVQIRGLVVPGIKPGVNYELKVPIDSGITSDLYKPTALRPTVPFKLQVRVGKVSYLPIEMTGDFAQLGLPGKSTRLDLTLGEDTDGDGMPDAWERAIIASLGGNLTLAAINPGDDSDGDGLSNINEYVAGTYAFDPQNGYNLEIKGFNAGRPILEFTAIRGRTYTVLASDDLKSWSAVPFTVREGGVGAALRQNYLANDVRLLRIEAGGESLASAYYRLVVQ